MIKHLNYEQRFKEIGLAFALSLALATPARSKVLPLSTQLTVSNNQTKTLDNSINNLDNQIYNVNVGDISILLDNLSKKGYNKQFPILKNQISPLTPILEQGVLAKKKSEKIYWKIYQHICE